jgi:hypothetical protein
MAFFVTWPADAKQKTEKLSNGGFFYTGELTSKMKTFLLQEKRHFL